MESLLLRAPLAAANTSLPDYAMSDAELAILRMPSLTCWLEVDSGLDRAGGWRWQMRNRMAQAIAMRPADPFLLTMPDGKLAIQSGYGASDYTGADRGSVRLPSTPDLLGETGWSVVTVLRVPTVASGESATVGGNIWACQGPADTSTPRLNISGSTGKPILNGGGKNWSNPTGDLRDGAWHVNVSSLDTASGLLRNWVDHNRWIASVTAATTPTPAGRRVPDLHVFRNSNAAPFYGQHRAFLTFNAQLSDADRLTVESYLAAKWGAALVGA